MEECLYINASTEKQIRFQLKSTTYRANKIEIQKTFKKNKLKRSKEEYFDYGVFLKDKNILIGRVGLGHFIRSVTQSSFVGYALFNPYWGQGIGFRKEGISKKIVLLRGQWQDLIQYALTTDDLKIKWAGEVQMRKK